MKKDFNKVEKKFYNKPEVKQLGSLTSITKGQTAVKYDTNTPGNTYSTVQ